MRKAWNVRVAGWILPCLAGRHCRLNRLSEFHGGREGLVKSPLHNGLCDTAAVMLFTPPERVSAMDSSPHSFTIVAAVRPVGVSA